MSAADTTQAGDAKVDRQRVGVMITACLTALLAGCSSGSHSAAPSVTTPATTSPATSTPTTPATTAAATPTATSPSTPGTTPPPSTGGAASCATRALSTKDGGTQGTAGSTYTTLDFTNISSTTCTLYGYPGVSLAGGTPVQQIGAAADHSSTPAKTLVTLAPGQVSHVLLKVSDTSNYAAADCDPVKSTYLQIYPPNQTTPIYFAYASSACRKPIHLLTVSVVQKGA